MPNQLKTERLVLEPIERGDQAFIFKGLSHPQVIPYYGVSYASFEAAGAQMDWYEQIKREGTGLWWKIREEMNEENAGAIGYNYHNIQHHKCEIGYWLLPEHWHKGIISEALKEVIRFLQKEKNVHRIEAMIELGNGQSCAVIEKAGFLYEGRLRDYEQKEGKYISLLLYSLLATDSASL
jgi:ribosomal-protein-alanine N-acetyltransferase